MNMILNEAQVALLERQAAAEYQLASARMLQAETKKLELENELLAIEVEEKRAEAQMREAERISSSTYAKQGPADVYYAWRAMGEPRGLNMAQTLQSAHTMRGGKLSEHAALQWGDVERSGLLEDLRVVERSPNAVVLDIKRRGRSPQRISWTIEDAQRAGIANSNTWRQYPARMLEARAKTEAATLIFSDITTGSGGSGANTYSTEEAAFFSGEDTEALSAVVGVPELAPSELPSAPPRPSATPAPSAPPQPSAPPRPSAPPQPAGPPAHIKLRFEQILSERKIPLETAMIYLRGAEVEPPRNYQALTQLIDQHFSLDGPFYEAHPLLLPNELSGIEQ
ncbi:MAG: hypothetical protein CMM54_00040 [Rhodospirillaceae bacterium]|nr:hypothetical protein [Rhodospirillaceae bacterium]